MDFQGIVDSVFSPACVVSVERKADGGYGNMRIAAGNGKYAELFKKRVKADAARVGIDAESSFVRDYYILNTSSRIPILKM